MTEMLEFDELFAGTVISQDMFNEIAGNEMAQQDIDGKNKKIA